MATGIIPLKARHRSAGHSAGRAAILRWFVRLGPALVVMAAATVPPAHAAVDISAICESAASDAARSSGVPATVLQAISLTETGRKGVGGFRPWPWTVNMEGKGYWFDTEDDARAFVYKEYKRGARSFDVGCFQINYKWHGEAFASIDQMFDPTANARYAARFLAELHGEFGSWSTAAGAYHSRDPAFADGYRKRFDRIHERVASTDDQVVPRPETGPDPQSGYPTDPGDRSIPEIPDIVLAANGGYDQAAAPQAPRVNSFPLLQTGTSAGMGSLVPIIESSGASLFEASLPRGQIDGLTD